VDFPYCLYADCKAPDEADVVACNAKNPLAKTGQWQSISIHPFNERVGNRDTPTATENNRRRVHV
jgi:hypothetical protein